jgi:hypothetical protein
MIKSGDSERVTYDFAILDTVSHASHIESVCILRPHITYSDQLKQIVLGKHPDYIDIDPISTTSEGFVFKVTSNLSPRWVGLSSGPWAARERFKLDDARIRRVRALGLRMVRFAENPIDALRMKEEEYFTLDVKKTKYRR